MAQYVDKDDFKAYIGLSGTAQDFNINTAINSACRLIDAVTGRRFNQDSSANAKVFTPKSSIYIDVPDISTTTGLIVKLDDNDDGTYETTLTINTDFIVEPSNPRIIKIDGGTTYYEPFNKITILDTRSNERFDPTIKNNVQVTAKWGYSIVPEDIKTATLWLKQKSTYTPDYFVEYLEDNPWIVQPMEKYEERTIEQLYKDRNPAKWNK